MGYNRHMDFLAPLIRPYTFIISNPLAGLFTLIALFQAWRGLQLGQQLWRSWSDIRQEPLTRAKKPLADAAAFYIAVPLGVLLHELGHAIAVWLYGGRVLEFGFFFFWGYVLPDRTFSVIQEWVISSAGTWANLLYALAIWLWLGGRQHTTPTRYFALRAVRFQLFFALIYYPIFTFLLSIGDWRVIYDFATTPVLSGATAVCHVLILWGHIQLEQRGYYEAPAFQSSDQAERFAQQWQQAQDNPQDLLRQEVIVKQLITSRAPNRARHYLQTQLKKTPEWADGYLLQALIDIGDKEVIPTKAISSLQKALSLGPSTPSNTATVRSLLGDYYTQTERYDLAQEQLAEAQAILQDEPEMPYRLTRLTKLYYSQVTLYRRQKDYSRAQQTLKEVILLTQQANDPQNQLAQYQRELAQLNAQLQGQAPF